MIRGFIDALRLSIGLFTVVPVRPVTPTRRTAGVAMLLSPMIGLGLGVMAAAVVFLTRLPLDKGSSGTLLLPAALGVTTMALLTRGLHLDGLADTVDGLGSMLPAEQARAVMRRGDVGPMGVVAVLLALLLQVAALTVGIIDGRGTETLVVAVVTGRLAAVLGCLPGVPAAERSGLGAMVSGTVARSTALVLVLLVGWAAASAGALDGDGDASREAVRGVAAVVAGLAAATVLRRHAVRRLGGITGDVLGALVEAATTASMVAMVL